MKYTSELTEKRPVAEGTEMFRFKKPEGFEFRAGQSMDITLIDPPETDAEGNTRPFSIVAAPSEPDLAITTRMRDTAFKRVLKNAAIGMPIQIEGPFGSFTLHENISKLAIFLVGGIGVTPFFSMLKDAAEKKLPHKIFLYYSNRRPEDTAFLRELTDLTHVNKNFTFIPTMTDLANSKVKWEGETGYITIDLVNKFLADRANAIYYAAGPQTMVMAMRKILTDSGVSGDDIRTEEFPGY